MLVLSRKSGQAVMIGKDMEIAILRIEGDEVRLGIKAPRSVTILRKELLEEIRSETESAQIGRKAAQEKIESLRDLAARLKQNKKI